MSLKLGKCVGEGGFGAVYIGMWHGQRCAVKQFHLRGHDKLIQQEIAHVKNLRHRHIIQFLATETYEGSLVMITDFAEGGTLQSAIKDRRLGGGWVKKDEIAKEIAKGLAYIHSNKIIHRDLKSSNVLLTRHLEVKLCDFGLAQVKISTASSHTSNRRSAEGTLRWMAPEVLALRPKYSTKSDMYALGMVMWEMAADCTTPFQDQRDNNVVVGFVRQGEREEIPEETPTDYKTWIERCWEQDPSKRPEAAEMFNEDMDDVGYASGSQASMVSITTSMSNFSTSTGGSRAPGSGGVSGKIKFTARPGLSSKLAARLSALVGEYAERANEMLSLFDGTLYVIPPLIVEELELMVTPLDQLLNDAKYGDAEAQYKLGRKYLQALGVEPDFEEGVRLLEQAADQGHAEAMFRRALRTMFCTITPSATNKDVIKGWLHRASDDGHVLANTVLLSLSLRGKSKEGEICAETIKALEAREVGGDGMASLVLGSVYQDAKEFDKAAHYWERAAMRGHLEGVCVIGAYYAEGWGVGVDMARAWILMSHAAARWNPVGQFALATMFREGSVVSRDEHKAVMLFRRSAAQGYSESKAALHDMKM
ncbi:hypothetical protein DFQ27_005884 [Actinomortierella ambigua]|uniref:Protein kinase domain-containing protein n=1 Tax=Actinomortierella ambigua TaxID=1343610 RepID=A0A9P6Q0Y7_9FUNG|nr:hypothetical protein DFQ27_005884 [Actinomortierella ambigua]